MPVPHLKETVGYLRQLAAAGTERRSDAELLAQFLRSRDEVAFAALVHRHGALVLGVCRRVLRQQQDAEDAFQATFLVLAQRAWSIRGHTALASWLHGVAYRVANKLRVRRTRRQAVEAAAAPRAATDPADESRWREAQTILDEELQRLPAQYRAPLVLCYLDGKTRDEAASELGWSLATLRGRLERGRDCLGRRLARRGLVVAAPLLGAALAQLAIAAAPPALLTVHTSKHALSFATALPVGLVPAPIAALAREVLANLSLWNVKAVCLTLVAVLVAGLLTAGAWSPNTGHVPPNGLAASSDPEPAPAFVLQAPPQQPGNGKAVAVQRSFRSVNVTWQKEEKIRLQGTWKAVHFEANPVHNGMALTRDGKPWQWIIVNQSLTEKNGNLFNPEKLELPVAARGQPHPINIGCRLANGHLQWVMGICKLEATKDGDRLTICTGDPRPADFGINGRPERLLIVLRRDKS